MSIARSSAAGVNEPAGISYAVGLSVALDARAQRQKASRPVTVKFREPVLRLQLERPLPAACGLPSMVSVASVHPAIARDACARVSGLGYRDQQRDTPSDDRCA